MILSLLFSGGDPLSILAVLLLTLPIMMLALSVHETAHGFVAWKCGDNTAYNLGRLSLNPLKHLDPVGFLCLLIFGFGWAKPVPINTRNFRNPKRGMALSALAGPVANLLLGLVSAVLFGICRGVVYYFSYAGGISNFLYTLLSLLNEAFWYGAYINFIYMVFNMIPIPPFDGSRVALAFLPAKTYFGLMRYERQIMFGILIALLLCSYIFSFSPFGWVAERLTDLIARPIFNGVLRGLLH